ncbi:hypothetical protein MXB_5510 [Myxobolus squamalis]|nr:hypothetical protein MXB_5510 [Myxobolus squamalis]
MACSRASTCLGW